MYHIMGMCTCFLDGGVSGVSFQGAAPPPPFSLPSFPAAAILECWMWRGKQEQATRGAQRGESDRNEEKNTNFNYAFIYNRNKGLLTGPQQRGLLGKPTGIFRLTSGESQCKWWCVNGTGLKTEEKYGMRVALSFDLTGASSFLSSSLVLNIFSLIGNPFKDVI